MRFICSFLVLIFALISCGASAETMRAISFIPKNDPVLAMVNAWVVDVNGKLGSQLRINYVGGPEVIGRFQQVEALRTGVVDLIFVPTGDYQDQMPASQAFVLSKLTPMEERKSGFYDFMVEEHSKKINARYLGRVQVSPFYLWTKKEPKTLADLHGLKMRSGVLYDRFMHALGMIAVTINAPEVYTALNSGVVDGFGWPVTGPLKRGWLETVKYVIDLPFFQPSNVVALMKSRQMECAAAGSTRSTHRIDGRFRASHGQTFRPGRRARMEGNRQQGHQGKVFSRRKPKISQHGL